MPKKLVVLAHGIGDSTANFYKDWQKVIESNHDLKDVTIRGLWWEDVLQKVAEQYPVVSGPFAELLKMCGFDQFDRWLSSEDAAAFKDYLMDVLVYVGLPDMWIYIQNECARKLAALRKNAAGREEFKRSDTILIGHSLGAAMLPQLAWRECLDSGAIPYRGMILLASPLGLESPYPRLCKDFLARMGHLGDDRLSVLTGFARAWNMIGDGRLCFVNNENDIVCSDVKYKIPGSNELVDVIPLRQGFNPAECHVLKTEHPGSVKWVSFGSADPRKIPQNHDVLTYLEQDSFNKAFAALLV